MFSSWILITIAVSLGFEGLNLNEWVPTWKEVVLSTQDITVISCKHFIQNIVAFYAAETFKEL